MACVNVLLFGPAKDAMDGKPSVAVRLDQVPASVSSLRTAIAEQYPKLSFVIQNSVFALNNRLIPRSAETSSTVADSLRDEVVLVPPVSGG